METAHPTQHDPTKISLRLKVYSKLYTPDYFFYPVHLLPGSNFQAKKHPPQKALCAKKLYTGEIMSVSAVPNAESNKDLVVDNPKPNL